MKYYLLNKNNEIISIMHNRDELLKTIREYHYPMYYCTNGSNNYSNKILIEIFNRLEKPHTFITRENKNIRGTKNEY